MSHRYLLAGLASLLVAGCGSGSGDGASPEPVNPAPPPPTSKVDPEAAVPETFASCEAYHDYLTEAFFNTLTQPRPCGFASCVGPVFDALDPAAFGALGTPAAAVASMPTSVSQTNTAVAGIDEGDLVEADSNGNLYVLSHGRLIVAQGFPPEDTQPIAELPLNGFPKEMLLDEANGRLVLLEGGYGSPLVPVYADGFRTMVSFVDVSDPAAPVLSGSLAFEGLLLTSRRYQDRIHLFAWRDLFLPQSFFLADGWDLVRRYFDAQAANDTAELARRAAELRAAIHESIGDDAAAYQPGYTTMNGVVQRVDCTDLAGPSVTVNPAFTTVASFDSDGGNLQVASLVNNIGSVHATATSAYLIQSSNAWWWDPVQADETAIYKYTIGDGAPEYRATGIIPGQTRSNLSLSEHAGKLRVATNHTRFDDGFVPLRRTNHLFVLEDNGEGQLDVIGAIEDFQADEDIFAVRFLGDRGYVVTFRQIDPLFTFDLSDPHNPRLVGELELPGFSTYIQQLDEQHLLTIGRAADENGIAGPLALRIFDVGDLSAPRLAHTFTLDDSGLPWSGWSPASYDYRAFTYRDGLLSLPFISYDNAHNAEVFSGFVYFGIDPEAGIAELGRINHQDLLDPASCQDPAAYCYVGPERSIMMSDGERNYIHTVSNLGVIVTPADDPANVLASFVIEPRSFD